MNLNMNSLYAKIIIFIISLSLIAVILIAVVISSDRGDDTDTSSTDEGVIAERSMVDFVGNGKVSVVISGPIVAREQHYKVSMEISANERVLEVSRGYGDSSIDRKRYANDRAAFSEFINALEKRGLENTKQSTTDVDGYCPSGERYVYNFNSPSYEFERWSNSCDTIGTLPSGGRGIRELFRNQFPDYREMVAELEVIDYHFQPQ